MYKLLFLYSSWQCWIRIQFNFHNHLVLYSQMIWPKDYIKLFQDEWQLQNIAFNQYLLWNNLLLIYIFSYPNKFYWTSVIWQSLYCLIQIQMTHPIHLRVHNLVGDRYSNIAREMLWYAPSSRYPQKEAS